MFEKLKNFFKSTDLREPESEVKPVPIPEPVPPEEPPQPPKPRKPRKKKEPVKTELSEKELATQNGEPYIKIIELDLDPNNINSGAITFDWNSKFVANLARAGYQRKPDETEDVIVDRWFKEICRNVVLEVYEQDMADPENREMEELREELRHIRSRDIGGGRSEVS